MTISEEILFVRKKYILTQLDFANILGLPNSLAVSHWETGVRLPPELILRLVRTLRDLEFEEGDTVLYHFARQSGQFVSPRYHYREWQNRGRHANEVGRIMHGPMPKRSDLNEELIRRG